MIAWTPKRQVPTVRDPADDDAIRAAAPPLADRRTVRDAEEAHMTIDPRKEESNLTTKDAPRPGEECVLISLRVRRSTTVDT